MNKAGNLILRIPAIYICYFVKNILLQMIIMDYQADLGCFLDYYPDYYPDYLGCLDCPDYLGYCLGYPGCYLGYWNYYCYSEVD